MVNVFLNLEWLIVRYTLSTGRLSQDIFNKLDVYRFHLQIKVKMLRKPGRYTLKWPNEAQLNLLKFSPEIRYRQKI